MNDTRNEQDDVQEIDLQRLMSALLHKSWLIAIIAILCAVLTFVGTFYFITPQYQSSALFYVNNSSLSVGDASFSISSGDISAAKTLVDSYIVILNSRTTLNDVIDYAGVNRTTEELNKMLSASAINGTEIFEVVATSPNPKEAERIANAVAYILPKRISSIIEGTSAQIVDTAIVASRPSSPNYAKNTFLGLILGLLGSIGVITVRFILDITIRTEDDINQISKVPILAAVPDMTSQSKGGYYYNDDKSRKKKKKASATSFNHQLPTVGADISFGASEAYKLLRTKIQFSFTDDNECHVLGVSSALSGEGKSLTSVNLAYTLSQLNKRVLLIDCDMRRPSLPAKLPIRKAPGLSGFLTKQNTKDDLIQGCGLPGEENAFHVIAAGRIPPNPVELLSSRRMKQTIAALRESYDYIVLDLPPIGEVSDAIAISQLTDGMLLVVRQNYCNRVVLKDAFNQFKFVNAHILGVVYNGVTEGSNGYYSKKYYKKYSGKYEGAHLAAESQASSRGENQSGSRS